jgi:hypothetical protein
MPKHIQAKCPDNGGDCGGTCNYCCLAICSVCGGGEGSLTTECCGEKMGSEREEAVYLSNLNYTDEKGWHHTNESLHQRKSPKFFHQCCTVRVTPVMGAGDFEDYVDVQCPNDSTFKIGSDYWCKSCVDTTEREEGPIGPFVGATVKNIETGETVYTHISKVWRNGIVKRW